MSARRRDAESDKAILGATESACKACGVERQGPGPRAPYLLARTHGYTPRRTLLPASHCLLIVYVGTLPALHCLRLKLLAHNIGYTLRLTSHCLLIAMVHAPPYTLHPPPYTIFSC